MVISWKIKLSDWVKLLVHNATVTSFIPSLPCITSLIRFRLCIWWNNHHPPIFPTVYFHRNRGANCNINPCGLSFAQLRNCVLLAYTHNRKKKIMSSVHSTRAKQYEQNISFDSWISAKPSECCGSINARGLVPYTCLILVYRQYSENIHIHIFILSYPVCFEYIHSP